MFTAQFASNVAHSRPVVNKQTNRCWQVAPDRSLFADAKSPSFSPRLRLGPTIPALDLSVWQKTRPVVAKVSRRRRASSGSDLPPQIRHLFQLNNKFERWSSQVKKRRRGVPMASMVLEQDSIQRLIDLNVEYIASSRTSSSVPLLGSAASMVQALQQLNMDYNVREVNTKKVSTKLARSPFEELERLNDAYLATTQNTSGQKALLGAAPMVQALQQLNMDYNVREVNTKKVSTKLARSPFEELERLNDAYLATTQNTSGQKALLGAATSSVHRLCALNTVYMSSQQVEAESVPLTAQNASVNTLMLLNSQFQQLIKSQHSNKKNLCGRSVNIERLTQLGETYNHLTAHISTSMRLQARDPSVDALLLLNRAYALQQAEQHPGVALSASRC